MSINVNTGRAVPENYLITIKKDGEQKKVPYESLIKGFFTSSGRGLVHEQPMFTAEKGVVCQCSINLGNLNKNFTFNKHNFKFIVFLRSLISNKIEEYPIKKIHTYKKNQYKNGELILTEGMKFASTGKGKGFVSQKSKKLVSVALQIDDITLRFVAMDIPIVGKIPTNKRRDSECRVKRLTNHEYPPFWIPKFYNDRRFQSEQPFQVSKNFLSQRKNPLQTKISGGTLSPHLLATTLTFPANAHFVSPSAALDPQLNVNHQEQSNERKDFRGGERKLDELCRLASHILAYNGL